MASKLETLNQEIDNIQSSISDPAQKENWKNLQNQLDGKIKERDSLSKSAGNGKDSSGGENQGGDKPDLDQLINDLDASGTNYSIVTKEGMVGVRTGGVFDAVKEGFKAGSETYSSGINSLPEELRFDVKKITSLFKSAGVKGDSPETSENTEVTNSNDTNRIWHDEKGNRSETAPAVDNEWYDDQRLESAVKNGLEKSGNNHNVEISGATPIGTAASGAPEVFNEILQDRIKDSSQTAQSGTIVSMNFQVNDNHWVGGVLSQNNEGNLQFIHNDPMGNKIDDNLNASFKEQGIEVIDLQKKQQFDDHNCGPFTADNQVKIVGAIQESRAQGTTLDINDIKLDEGEEAGAELRRSQSEDTADKSSEIRGVSATFDPTNLPNKAHSEGRHP